MHTAGPPLPRPSPPHPAPPTSSPTLYVIPRKGIKASPSKAEVLSASEQELKLLLWDRAHAAHTLLARGPHWAAAGLVLEMGIGRIRAASQALPAQGAPSRWRPRIRTLAPVILCGMPWRPPPGPAPQPWPRSQPVCPSARWKFLLHIPHLTQPQRASGGLILGSNPGNLRDGVRARPRPLSMPEGPEPSCVFLPCKGQPSKNTGAALAVSVSLLGLSVLPTPHLGPHAPGEPSRGQVGQRCRGEARR